MFTAAVLWIKSERRVLQIVKGTGDNLDDEDIADGCVDYVMYSVYDLENADMDEELALVCDDGGQLLRKEEVEDVIDTVPDVYEMAFDKPYDNDDVIVLQRMEEE